MQTLFTPWRYAYITTPTADPGCFLCAAAVRPEEDGERLVVARARHHLLMLNRHPYSNGHLMIAPYEHLASPEQAGLAAREELWPLVLRARKALELACRPHGFNLGMNLGTCAGAGVPGHYHFHVVPRWNGDTNFMTVLAETRLVPEDLAATAARLRGLLAEDGS